MVRTIQINLTYLGNHHRLNPSAVVIESLITLTLSLNTDSSPYSLHLLNCLGQIQTSPSARFVPLLSLHQWEDGSNRDVSSSFSSRSADDLFLLQSCAQSLQITPGMRNSSCHDHRLQHHAPYLLRTHFDMTCQGNTCSDAICYKKDVGMNQGRNSFFTGDHSTCLVTSFFLGFLPMPLFFFFFLNK